MCFDRGNLVRHFKSGVENWLDKLSRRERRKICGVCTAKEILPLNATDNTRC